MDKVNRQITDELYKALEALGAEADLLGIVGSWGDSLPDDSVLRMLKTWNMNPTEPA